MTTAQPNCRTATASNKLPAYVPTARVRGSKMGSDLATLISLGCLMTLQSLGNTALAETASAPSRDQPSQSPVPIAINSDVQLLGTISGDKVKSGGRSVALIKHRASGRIAAVPLGGKAFDSGQISDIQNKTIVITDSSGSKTMVTSKLGGAWAAGYVPPPPAALPVSGERYSELGFERVGNHSRIDAAYRDRMVSKELPTILMSAASEPVVENGTIQGFRLFQFEPGSVFEKLGMEDGDIVSSINGVSLNDVARTIQFLNGLKAEKQVEVSIIRNGKPVTLSLDVN